MNILKKSLLVTSALLLSPFVLADCVPTSFVKHATMTARGNPNIELSGDIQKNQLLATITNFVLDRNSPIPVACSNDSSVWLRIVNAEDHFMSTPYGVIDGLPAFFVPSSYMQYAYVLIDNKTGLAFNNDVGQKVAVDGDTYDTPSVTLKIYAAVDNPNQNLEITGMGKVFGRVMFHTKAIGDQGYLIEVRSFTIGAPPVLCDLDPGSNDLRFVLAREPISAFDKIGATAGNQSANLSITCTGKMTARMQLTNNNLVADDQGLKAVITPEKDGQGANAQGIGFVISSGDKRINGDKATTLPQTLGKGTTQIPIKAQYYRYGNEVKAGKIEAFANFNLTFN